MCLDWTSIELSGEEPATNTRTLDVMFLPCGQSELWIGGKEKRIPDDCNYDRDELIKYLGPLQMLMYENVGRF